MIETANSIHSKRNNQQEYSKRFHEEMDRRRAQNLRAKIDRHEQAIMGMGEIIGQPR